MNRRIMSSNSDKSKSNHYKIENTFDRMRLVIEKENKICPEKFSTKQTNADIENQRVREIKVVLEDICALKKNLNGNETSDLKELRVMIEKNQLSKMSKQI